MAMPEMKSTTLGKLNLTVYDFVATGDTLPMHSHTPENNHITVVARGSFKAHGDGWERTLSSGDVADWQPDQPHEFIALEDKSRIVNILKGND
jgi:quercetin dioxygenase-like cupin family protein